MTNPHLAEDFARDGAVVVRNLFSADEMALLERGIERNMASPSTLAIVASRPEDPGYFLEDFCNWQRIKEYHDFIFHSPAANTAGTLMQSRETRLYHDHLLVKEPKTIQKTPWHQDQPYYNIDGLQNCSMWLPVDPVAEASTLRFVAGSHREGWMMPRSFMSHEAKWFPEGSLKELPDIDADPERYKILAWALEPGDAVFFHMLTLHGAGGAGSGRRRVLSVRFIGDDITHAPRPWRTSPPFPGLADDLAAGARMNHALFPVLALRAQLA
jgi:ectoine hydroxylase-related dioxygenase (phytanoyl-CoA dioxygenase family)